MPTRISYVSGSNEPVTVDEVKLAARIDTDALDAELAALITSAREQAEHLTGRCYRPQVLREELPDWPAVVDAIAVHQATAAAVSYWAGGPDFTALAGAAYLFAPGGIGGNGTVLAPVTGTSWPVLADRPVGPRVRIDLTAGPAAVADVPECVKLYIKASVSAWVNNPDAIGKAVTPNPLFERLLDAERLY